LMTIALDADWRAGLFARGPSHIGRPRSVRALPYRRYPIHAGFVANLPFCSGNAPRRQAAGSPPPEHFLFDPSPGHDGDVAGTRRESASSVRASLPIRKRERPVPLLRILLAGAEIRERAPTRAVNMERR
jgi:hypothetical protein